MNAPSKISKISNDGVSMDGVGDEALWKIDGPMQPHIELYVRDAV